MREFFRSIRISKEDKSGLYLTVIAHLTVLIVLLISQISTSVKGETSYLLDFSDMEREERERLEAEFKESISDRLDDLIAAAPHSAVPGNDAGDIRNIAVDAGSSLLKDDRNTDVEKLYGDAERLARELRSGAFSEKAEDYENYAAPAKAVETPGDNGSATYTGPSVVSYSLDGRKAVTLSVPAYRCLGGGDVTVRITVEQSGTVSDVQVVEEFSSEDRCLREYAKKAARLSRFTASSAAPKRQMGEIVYRFIAQQ